MPGKHIYRDRKLLGDVDFDLNRLAATAGTTLPEFAGKALPELIAEGVRCGVKLPSNWNAKTVEEQCGFLASRLAQERAQAFEALLPGGGGWPRSWRELQERLMVDAYGLPNAHYLYRRWPIEASEARLRETMLWNSYYRSADPETQKDIKQEVIIHLTFVSIRNAGNWFRRCAASGEFWGLVKSQVPDLMERAAIKHVHARTRPLTEEAAEDLPGKELDPAKAAVIQSDLAIALAKLDDQEILVVRSLFEGAASVPVLAADLKFSVDELRAILSRALGRLRRALPADPGLFGPSIDNT